MFTRHRGMLPCLRDILTRLWWLLVWRHEGMQCVYSVFCTVLVHVTQLRHSRLLTDTDLRIRPSVIPRLKSRIHSSQYGVLLALDMSA